MHQDVINQYAQIDELNPFNVPSPHMTIQHVKQLKDIILKQYQINIMMVSLSRMVPIR